MYIKPASTIAIVGGLILSAAIPFSARATLTYENLDGTDFVYDSLTMVTWTRDGNISGMVYDWSDAQTWAADLSLAGIGASGWQLPTGDQFMSLYGQLEGVDDQNEYGAQVLFGSGPNDFVANVSPEYWTDADQVDFNFYYGFPGERPDSNFYPAWAVTSQTPVPEPSSLAFGLLACGLAVRPWRSRRKL